MNFLKNSLLVVGFLFAVVMTVLYKCESNKNKQLKLDNKILVQNEKALSDSLRTTTTKTGEPEQDKYTFIVQKLADLEKVNKSLYEEVKKTKGSVIAVSQAVANIKTKDQPLEVKVDSFKTPIDTGVVVNLKFDTVYSVGNYRYLRATAKVGNKDTSAVINLDSLGFTATTGLKKNTKGDYEIFFRSNYPGMVLTDLQGAYIPKNQLKTDFKRFHRFNVGLSLGPPDPVYFDFQKGKIGFDKDFYKKIGIKFGININF